ncbi:MAG: class I SAM-dependent methyltransferase [Flavipsychrobacter sp.]|nr:class I SAM-dependent methyltransferase [Flavipsychrobacter sp.]
MKRELTNSIRYIMDNWLPPVIRDNKYFMYPAFHFWFRGAYINEIMDFKRNVFYMTDAEYSGMYEKIKVRAKDRPTDMNDACVDFSISNMDKTATTLLDVGCGRGYYLNEIAQRTQLRLTGCDMMDSIPGLNADYAKGFVEHLPFADNTFDIVTCTHTVEHILDLKQAVNELKRVARKQLIIVTPRQKYNYYTLDLHVNFYPIKELLLRDLGVKDALCENVGGDWVCIIDMEKERAGQ